MVQDTIKTNGWKAWGLAVRPKTLAGAVAPVIVALSVAWSDGATSFNWLAAVLCLAFAVLMQTDANLVNDYVDYIGGRDISETRLGPPRACSEGWITPRAMQWGIALMTLLACAVGLPLVLWGGWWMIAIGVGCVVFCFLYSTLLASLGLGDVLVLLFFGLVPVCATYFLQTGTITLQVLLLSLGMGLATDCLLMVNNYRDRDQDLAAGKRTIVVHMGARAAEWTYLLLGIMAVLLPLLSLRIAFRPPLLLPLLYLIPHSRTWRKMVRLNHGRALNAVLGQTAMCILLYALLESLSALL